MHCWAAAELAAWPATSQP